MIKRYGENKTGKGKHQVCVGLNTQGRIHISMSTTISNPFPLHASVLTILFTNSPLTLAPDFTQLFTSQAQLQCYFQ